MSVKERKVEVCKCENCGNEAEMVVTCEMVTIKSEVEDAPDKKQEKRNFTCVNCGNEADMIIDEE